MPIANQQDFLSRSALRRHTGLFRSLFWVIVPIICAVTVSFAGYRYFQTNAPPEIGDEAVLLQQQTAPVVAPSPPQQQMQAELITITPRGFEPSVTRRPAGRVLLAVVNRSERSTVKLRLERENGSVLGRADMPANRRHWRVPVTLPAGRFRLVDANHPNVVCNIEITP